MQLFFSSIIQNKIRAFYSLILITAISGLFSNSIQAQGYCIPVYIDNCSSGDFINNFSFNTLSKQNSGCNGNANNYIYDLTTTTSVDKGGAYLLSMQSGPTYGQGFGVWIDYNKDGDFTDANEFVYESPTSSKELFSAYISIPAAASTGLTRLRVRCKYSAKVLAGDVCSTLNYGEAEDYNVTIVQPPNCTNPPVAGTAITSKSFVCDPSTLFYLTLNGCPNATGQTYQWQKSSNGISWSDIFGATTKAISQTISQSTHFRCIVTCSGSSISVPVLVSISSPYNLNFSANEPSCYGLNNGSVTALLTGGTSPYSYAWSVGASPFGPPLTYPNAATIDSVYANNFNVLITDANGCTTSGSYWLNQPFALYLQKDTGSSTCLQSNGLAGVTVFNGTLPYSYLWQGGQTTDTITAVPAGIYSVTVTDGNGCTASTSVPVKDLGTPVLTFTTTDVSCFNGNNGTATVTASGGIPPFTYSWNTTPPKTTTSISGLSAGTHFVTVTNFSGCKAISSAYVYQPGELNSNASSTPVSCSGNCDGIIYTSITGGTWPYTYLWSNGKSDYYIDTLCAGNYTLTITDANSCTLVETHPVAQPLPVSANATHMNVSCFGYNDGLISVIPTGGKSPYSLNWLPLNVVGDTAFALIAGTYSVIVTDSDTCGAGDTAYVNIIQPAAITTTVTGSSAACYGTCTGDVAVTASGGTGAFTYFWLPSEAVTPTASYLCAGNHTVVVTDKNSCVTTNTVTVGQPLPVPATATATPASCTSKIGTASVSVSGPGAVPPYSFLWNIGSTTNVISGLTAGIYRANVTDGNGCFGFADALVTSSNGPVIATTSITVISCYGLSNGTIDISVSGGSAPYTYSWSNGQTTEDASGLSYGPYEIKVTDATGCKSMKSIFVNEPAMISLSHSVINSGCTATNGSATVLVNGGNSPYSYVWSAGGTAATKSGLGAGHYKVLITDSKGCQDSIMIAVQDSGGPIIFVDTIAAAQCGSNGYVLLVPQDSTQISSYQWSTGSTAQNLSNATPGNYGVVITDISGCKSVLITPVKPELPPLKPICLVTVDTLTHQNIIVWEKPVSTLIAGFNIYRESSMQGIYQKIGYSTYSTVSTYYDPITDPEIKWARYRISMKDVCGTEGPKSPEHKTIHLSVQFSSANSTTLIWDDYVGYPFSYYNIYRKDSINGIWNLIGAMPANMTTFTDAAVPNTGDTIFYHVDVDHTGGDCIATIKNPEPMAKTVKSSKSNSSDRVTNPASSVAEISDNLWLSIFPNPNSGTFTVQMDNGQWLMANGNTSTIKVYNVLGEIQHQTNVKGAKTEITIPDIANGIYQLQVITKSGTVNRKIIISK